MWQRRKQLKISINVKTVLKTQHLNGRMNVRSSDRCTHVVLAVTLKINEVVDVATYKFDDVNLAMTA